jgi:hypothetical protein
MHLAYSCGADRLWIVNVGDIKPMEFPTQFFLDYAWNPGDWPAERLPEYTKRWAVQQFGARHAGEIADILTKYTQYNSRRKPELLSPNTYSLTNYREAEIVVEEYKKLAQRAQRISNSLLPEFRDAFFQLVLHPVLACSNLNEMYLTVGKNHLFAKQGRASTNELAEQVGKLFANDSAISYHYNKTMAGGKWDHMMDQTHISYTYWQQPDKDVIPETKRITLPVDPSMGVSAEGSESWFPGEAKEITLPEFDRYNKQKYYLEIFNRATTPFRYSIKIGKPWIQVSSNKGRITTGSRLWVSVDWKKAPAGDSNVPIVITGPGNQAVTVQVVINNPRFPSPRQLEGFVESNGYVSIEAEHYTRAVGSTTIGWQRIPGLGRTLSAMTPATATAVSQTPGGDTPRLEYSIYLFDKGEVSVAAYLSPTLNFHSDQGLRYAISFDDQPLQIINMHAGKTFQDWEGSVRNNISILTSKHAMGEPGRHVLKFWMVDPGVILQKLVVETRKIRPSYLGPPESFHSSTIARHKN